MNLKSSLLIVLLTATAGANASILNLTGKDVLYSINTDADWFQGLVASVTGNTLTFKTTDGSNYLDLGVNGRHVNQATTNSTSSDWGDVIVSGRNGHKINGVTSFLTGSVDARVTGVRPSYIAELDSSIDAEGFGADARYTYWSYNEGSGNTTVSSNDPHDWDGSESNQPEIFNTSARFNPVARTHLGFGAYEAVSKQGVGYVNAHITDFGVTTSVAPVPEPETYALMGLGLVGLLVARRRKLV